MVVGEKDIHKEQKSQYLCHTVATGTVRSERCAVQTEPLMSTMVESLCLLDITYSIDHLRVCVFPCEKQIFFFNMQGYNMRRWCYFRSRFSLGLRRSAAVVALARVAWHILK